jgi:hypothetical protein
MGDTLQHVRELVRAGTVKISEHGYDELAADGISVREIVEGLQDAFLIRSIRLSLEGRASLFVRETSKGTQSMPFGAFLRMSFLRQF